MKPDLNTVIQPLVVGLNAVIFAASEGELKVLVTESLEGGEPALPFGPFDPSAHRTFEIGLREWVRGQTGFELGYVEQLYTFGDRGREAPLAALAGAQDARVLSVGYLGLTPDARPLNNTEAHWDSWTRFFPWEDHRCGRPAILIRVIEPALRSWWHEPAAPGSRATRFDGGLPERSARSGKPRISTMPDRSRNAGLRNHCRCARGPEKVAVLCLAPRSRP